MTGVRIARDATGLYLTSPVLLVIAVVPAAVRGVQVLRSGGPPDGTALSEGLLGIVRVLFAAAAIPVAAGWRPTPRAWRTPDLSHVGAAWRASPFDWSGMVIDLIVYGIVYGLINLAIAAASGDPVLWGLVQPRSTADPAVATHLVVFVSKNLTVISVATIHILWALRLIRL